MSYDMFDLRIMIFSRQTCPCNNCERREVGCHAKCEDYAEYHRRLEIYREEQKKIKHKEVQLNGYTIETQKKLNREKEIER